MKKELLGIILFMLLLLSGGRSEAAPAAGESRADFPAVLMYHDVRKTACNYFDVTVEDFSAQLDWLLENGYETLSMEEFVSCLREGKGFPEKSVLITFDDGYRGIYEYAAPELKKRGMKGTFFIITGMVGLPDDLYPYITKKELKKLAADPLFSIGSHTISHPHLDQLDPEQKKKEIGESRKLLQEWSGREIQALAFPYGAYDKEVLREIQAAGYDLSFAVQDRGLLHESPRYSIPRIYVGLELGKDHLEAFGDAVSRYREMPASLFVERWEPLEE